ncbi:WYL domain-containing protein [Corynebacterium sp. LK2537]|uniref:helix-turn-helix transcriptional regulator n=1 Tax=Corynebacterium sp. LK2537 TaxID=3110471 RepID=UPI0034CE81EF
MADAPQKLHALVQSLNLIPYFRSHPKATLMEAAQDLGMDVAELNSALNRLFCSGVGQRTEDLIDISFGYREGVTIVDDQGLNQALRLTPTEAGALLLTLESLESMPGLIDTAAVQSAAEKVRGIMDDKTRAIYDSIAQPEEAESAAQVAAARAIETKRQLRLRYWSASSNEERTRTVHPARIFIFDSQVYLVAWEEDKGEHRRFRMDRIRQATVLDEEAQPHLRKLDFDPRDPFGLADSDRAHMELKKEATWLADDYDIRLGEDLGNGYVAASMPIGSVEWFARFAIGHADRFRVIGPDSVKNAIAHASEAGLQRYTD